MVQRTDLYPILVSYANKNNSPYIQIDAFLDFLEQYAKNLSAEKPEWLKWANDKAVKFWAEISPLVQKGKCELVADAAEGRIYMTSFYPQRIEKMYQSADRDADIPFFNEESLGITLPESQVRPLRCEFDLASYLADPQKQDTPILRITFPEKIEPALILASMVPRRAAEIALLKIRNYLRKGGNKDYILRKLLPQLQNKESGVRDQFNRILIRPLECYSEIAEGREFPCLFWAHFCVTLKNDIKNKKELLSGDIAAAQAAYIIDTISGYYKSLALKQRDMELAFRNLEGQLAKPPFFYTLDQVRKFTNSKGTLLLSQYTNNDLQTWLRKKTTESEKGALPALLIVNGDGDQTWFVLKEKMLALCIRLLAVARNQIKGALTERWRETLLDCRSEPAMENDETFEDVLLALVKKHCPMLAILLDDIKLPLVYGEAERNEKSAPLPVKIFEKGRRLPYSTLLLIRRKEVLSDVKFMIPLWYSIPIVGSIISFFKGLFKRKKPGSARIEDGHPEERDTAGEMRAAAQEIEAALIPPGYTIEKYMEELEPRWNRLIDSQARTNLVEDVKSLTRDKLRKDLRLKKRLSITRKTIGGMAQDIVDSAPSLSSLSGRNSLVLYVELYLLKLLRNLK
ncbi:MAG: hypothetical protein FWC64_12235 [Treponema sp.]|nr:hypothetical protein [Treponema sp.]